MDVLRNVWSGNPNSGSFKVPWGLIALWLIPRDMYTPWISSTWIVSSWSIHILEVSKYHSNIDCTPLASIKARILIQRLIFLPKLLPRYDGFSSHIFSNSWFRRRLWGQSGSAVYSLEQEFGTGDLQLYLQNPMHKCMLHSVWCKRRRRRERRIFTL